MATAEIERCANHSFERATRFCGRCGHHYCDDCLVTPFARRPPLCKPCAVAAAGIRSNAGAPPIRSPGEIRAMQRAERRSERETRQAEVAHGPGFGHGHPAFVASPFLAEPGVVPVPGPDTQMPARTRRIWRPAN